MADISILIPTMTPRKALFDQVLAEIQKQAAECPQIRTEILWESDNGELTLGQKRNVLMDRCTGTYHCFIDDDDILAPDYLKTFVPMITSGVDYDCASFVGAHYKGGVFTKLFHHSMDYAEWAETPERYIRTISPMNLIKTDIVRQVRYKDIRNTEDHEFSKRLMASGLLKTEFRIHPNHPIYHYIDGVKQDREQWKHAWESPDRLRLWKQPSYDFHAQFRSTGAIPTGPLQFLRLSRP
jgi:glycosyltransferase involved in cell wall biosynthesis